MNFAALLYESIIIKSKSFWYIISKYQIYLKCRWIETVIYHTVLSNFFLWTFFLEGREKIIIVIKGWQRKQFVIDQNILFPYLFSQSPLTHVHQPLEQWLFTFQKSWLLIQVNWPPVYAPSWCQDRVRGLLSWIRNSLGWLGSWRPSLKIWKDT